MSLEKFTPDELKISEYVKDHRGNEVGLFTHPITPRENYLRLYNGKTPMWIPFNSEEHVNLRIDCDPENQARSPSGGIDGYGVCREIRTKYKVPIIVLSAKGDTFDKVLALELGADDYVEKPFDTKEIVARVKAALRRASYTTPVEEPGSVDKVSYPGLSINLTEYSVVYNNEPVDMPPKEIELLYFLAKTPNHVFTREQLLDKIWGYEYLGDTRTVDVHIKRIREKINDHEMWKISTIWGIGYKFELKDDSKF